MIFFFACQKSLPEDPAEAGDPVGVRTELLPSGAKVEVWYPADTSDPPDDVPLDEFIPAAVSDALGPFELPAIPSIAVRDAALADGEGPYPVVVFSHGFGGMRVQSVDLTAHLASRRYVVVATDHAGRSMPDLLPCLFLPPLTGCTLAFEDESPEEVAALLDWLQDPPAWLAGAVDLDHLGIVGHSAGAGTAVAVANDDPRFGAVLPLAGGDVITRDVPALRMAGTCDGIVPADTTNDAFAGGPASEVNVLIAGAGHLAFSDLCAVDLAGLGADLFAGRDDVNELFLDLLTDLGTDGCPGSPPAPGLETCDAAEYLDLETSSRIVRHYATAALDAALRAEGPGAEAGLFPEAEVTRR